MIDTKYSPSRNNYSKRPRKVNTFSNTVVHNNEVGEFQGGYFIMPDDSNHSLKKKAPSPARRKHSEPPLPSLKSTYSPSTTPNKKNHTPPSSYSPSPVVVVSEKEINKTGSEYELLTPASISKTAIKPVPTKQNNIQSFILDTPDKRSPSKMNDIASSAPTTPSSSLPLAQPSTPSCRWAGPAFGNAPHPSTLPIPCFPPARAATVPADADQQASYFYAHGRSLSVDSSLSSLSSYPQQDTRSHSPPTHPDLDQLSIDLRRMLNIGGGSNGAPVSA